MDSFWLPDRKNSFPLSELEKAIYQDAFLELGMTTKCFTKIHNFKFNVYYHANEPVFSLKGLWAAANLFSAFIIPYKNEGTLEITMTSPNQNARVIPIVEWRSFILLFGQKDSDEIRRLHLYSETDLIVVKTIAEMIQEEGKKEVRQ